MYSYVISICTGNGFVSVRYRLGPKKRLTDSATYLLGLVYTGRVTRLSEMGPVTRASNSTLPLLPCCCSHDTISISQ